MTSPPADTGPNSPPTGPLSQPTQPSAIPNHPSSRKPRQKRPDTKSRRSTAPTTITTTTNTAVLGPDTQHSLQQPLPRGPVHQYTSAPFIMNSPSYHVNGAPFSAQQYQPQHPPPATPTGPGIPAQYAFHLPGPYHPPPHGYTYAQYSSPPMVMVPPQRPAPSTSNSQTPQTQPTPSPAARPNPSTGKRKRKSEASPDMLQTNLPEKSDDEAMTTGSDIRIQKVQQPHAPSPVDMRKRTKTQRACDSCRTRKIRCDVLADVETPICQHCKQYGFECTFFLPITETRFKKKKLEEEMAEKEKTDARRATASPRIDSSSHAKGDSNVFGPTSAVHLLHSLPAISSRAYETYDTRNQLHWEVSKDGDGFIQINKFQNEEQKHSHSRPQELRLEKDVIEKLVNAYFTDIAPLLPVVTKAEFLANSSPPPILLYSMCLVAAARRGVSQSIFDSIRFAVQSIIKTEDVLSTASIVNVQALLILCMMADCHSQFVPQALSALWIRIGTAIRMAQGLGLHLTEAVKENVELRRRLWTACVISDRWISIAYGHPFMIDVHDCDVRLPSSGDPNSLYMSELLRLSVILGRVLKTIYSPSGLAFTDDKMLDDLLRDMQAWKENLPDDLKYRGPESSRSAGLLHILFACVSVIFWRVFMRISYACPPHLKFGPTVETWTGLMQVTGEAIDWLDANEKTYDIWLVVPYAVTSCAIVQYNSWARRKDADAAAKLRKIRDCVKRWEGSLSPEHMSTRRKTAEIICLLYESTQGPSMLSHAATLNPTSGVTVVTVKPTADGMTFNADPPRESEAIGTGNGESPTQRGAIPPVNNSSSDGAIPSPGTTSSLVNLTPLAHGGSYANVNPAMNFSGDVQVMSVLDVPQAPSIFELLDFGMAGIPRGLYDWVQWDFIPGIDWTDADSSSPGAFLQQQQSEPSPLQGQESQRRYP